MLRCRKIGIAHPHIDDVLTRSALGTSQLSHLGEDVGGKSIQLVEIVSELIRHIVFVSSHCRRIAGLAPDRPHRPVRSIRIAYYSYS